MLLDILLYVDPGSGSFLFQMLISGLLAVVFFFKLLKHRIQHFFRKIFPKKNKDHETHS